MKRVVGTGIDAVRLLSGIEFHPGLRFHDGLYFIWVSTRMDFTWNKRVDNRCNTWKNRGVYFSGALRSETARQVCELCDTDAVELRFMDIISAKCAFFCACKINRVLNFWLPYFKIWDFTTFYYTNNKLAFVERIGNVNVVLAVQ